MIPKVGTARADERASASTVGIILIVGLAVVMAGVVGAYVFDTAKPLADQDEKPRAIVDVSDAPEQWDTLDDESNPDPGYPADEQLLTIEHDSGDAMRLEALRIVVEPDGGEEYVLNARNDYRIDVTDGDGSVEYELGFEGVDAHANASDTLSTQETLVLREAVGADTKPSAFSGTAFDQSDPPELDVTVRIVHEPSQSIVTEETVTVT